MPLPYQRISQVPDALMHYVSNLHDMGFRIPDSSSHLPVVVVGYAAQLMPEESVKINLFNVHLHRAEGFRPVLTLRMDDNQQITWDLELPA